MHSGKSVPTRTCRCTVDKDRKRRCLGFEKGSGVNKRKGGGDHVLFCLDGVGWSHIVAGDVAALASRQGTSEPPITFSVTRRGRGKTARVKTLIKENEFT